VSNERTGNHLDRWRETVGRSLRTAATAVCLVIVLGAPLAVGSVHPPTVAAVFLLSSLSLGLILAMAVLKKQPLRGGEFIHFHACLAGLALIQLVPLPLRLRNLLDPRGGELLANAPGGAPSVWPLSLDPHSTQQAAGVVAAALTVFLVAANHGARRGRSFDFVRAVAFAGLAGLAIGIAHRVLDLHRIYGIFATAGAILPGPFINPNHAAEFFILAAFSSLSLAFASNAEARIGWALAAAINGAGALATLSRGSLLALVVGGAAFLILRERPNPDLADALPSPRRWKRVSVGVAFGAAATISLALAFGAWPIVDELLRTELAASHEKPVLWRDALAVLWAHPFGIGRGAFTNVYPAYRTIPGQVRFDFVENGALQLLIDFGWLGAALLLGSFLLLLHRFRHRRRKDDVEAALVGGLVALLVHNLVDFGFETLGILVPFAAIAGVTMGRTLRNSGPSRSFRGAKAAAAVAAVGLMVGVAGAWKTRAAEYEAAIREAPSREERRAISERAARAYPTDYFFPLLQSFDEPVAVDPNTGRSPRLVALNRALRLCPGCGDVHVESARVLWSLGLRSQAMGAWRQALRLEPARFGLAVGELDSRGASTAELASLAITGPEQTLSLARFLLRRKAEKETLELLEQAKSEGAPDAEIAIIRADLAVALGRQQDAFSVLISANRDEPRNASVRFALARLEQQRGNLDSALEHARNALQVAPDEPAYARKRLELVVQRKEWKELDTALSDLRAALRRSGRNVTEVHVLAAQAFQARGNLPRALQEYRAASLLEPENQGLLHAVGNIAEAIGELSISDEAYRGALRLNPDDKIAADGLERIRQRRKRIVAPSLPAGVQTF
jgi:Flp pilus assembly protein TadD